MQEDLFCELACALEAYKDIFLKENPVLRDELEQKIREHYGFIEKIKDKKEKN